ncbi:hypothetical protein [Streptomyces sporangiiformans]|uniref:hypothetical protein n=1 Tax=Streptomyces sporangiiformans TaxID=2315329 RepID=UPI0013C4C975|nr:hypothetical protein [Streptomyces sporangiiformans]
MVLLRICCRICRESNVIPAVIRDVVRAVIGARSGLGPDSVRARSGSWAGL